MTCFDKTWNVMIKIQAATLKLHNYDVDELKKIGHCNCIIVNLLNTESQIQITYAFLCTPAF